MNKKLLALAIAGVVAAPAALAQSANPVTLYGRVFVMFDNIKADGAASLPSRNVVKDESSFVGVRGTEDLGGGLKAFFQIESGAPADTGGGTWGSRNSAVGLQGNFGSLLLGRWDTPMKVTVLQVDPSGQLTIADPLSVISDKGNFQRRQDNSVQYWTPTWGGFNARVMYSANEGKTGSLSPSTAGLNMHYAAGPFFVGFAYEKHKDLRGALPTDGVDEKAATLAGSAKFGPFKIGLMGQKIKKTGLKDIKVAMVTGQYDVGKHSIWAIYARAKDGAVSDATQPEGKHAGLGYYYNFSKRTTFVATYARIKNNSVANHTFNGNGSGTFTVANDSDPKGFGVGFRHLF